VEAFRDALYVLTRAVIERVLYAAHPDEIYDVTLHLDDPALADVGRLRELIAENDDVQRALLLGGPPSQEIATGLFQRWVSAYRDLTGQLTSFEEARADELFADLDAMRSRETVPVVLTTPLFTFVMEQDELELASDLKIGSRRGNPFIRREIDHAGDSLLHSAAFPYAASFALTSAFETSRAGLDASSEMDRHFRVISALRLLGGDGAVRVGPHVAAAVRPALCLPNNVSNHAVMAQGVPQFNPFVQTFVLQSADRERLIEFVGQLDALADDAALAFALRRFADSFARTRADDKIVDYWIALESMFSTEKTEVTYRVSMRTARFIGATGDERRDLRGRLKHSYGVRSSIVHGTRVRAERLNEVESETATLLRRALVRWLQVGGTSAATLDDEMLG